MGKYNAYEKYKDSGVEWLEEIPEHWEVKRLKRFAKICNGCDHKDVWDENGEYPIIGSGGIFGRASQYLYDKPSVLLGRKGTIDKPQFINVPFWSVDTAYYTDIFPTTNPNFFFYLCLTIDFELYKYGSAVPSMTQEKLNQILFPAPPLPEQQAIAQFLDYKTKQIDDLIAKKETLLEKLDEKRTAIISHAVTKGLDPNVSMKDSGIEWLGEIPEHLEMKRLKFVVSQIIDAEHKTASYDNYGDYLVVRTANVRAGKLLLENAKFTNESVYQEWTIRAVPEKGDILFTREAPAGEACLVPEKPIVCLGQRMVLFKFNKNQYDGYFLLQSLYSGIADEFIKSLSLGSTVAHFNMSDIGSIPLFIPPYNEQKKVGEYLAEKINDFDEQVKKVKTGIELLKEYRTALITNAVTGKIDVRQVPIP